MVDDQNGKRLKRVWRADEFEAWCAQLQTHSMRLTGNPQTFYRQVHTAIGEYVDNSQGWVKSSFIPGKDWTDTPYDPIYECLGTARDEAQWNCARWFFGNFVCRVLMDRPEVWGALPKPEKEDGMLYHLKS